ncbi:alpha/beta fold hydrolase [Actinomycetospora endophytica]|uniref:Alpha/beta fold hydrolase n=1 Tax=Actinomycetospora endophytica TaxID=2291215 RepID=A0ABS8P9P3_9PSEU|nr:alpha/beta fold hydrolase [Actinomycetospora endophytica]MCD2194969.1 alpha/beta fold hydrolase [Actinomycetospora endophytica]
MSADDAQDDERRPLPAPRNEVRGAAGVASETVDIVSRPVEGTHRAISDTVFATLRKVGLGPASRPVQVLHDGITGGVYTAVRGIGHAAGTGVGLAAEIYRTASGRTEWTPITSRPAGAVIAGAVNGLVGDHMVAVSNDLAVPMALHTSTIDAEGETRHAALPMETEAIRDTVADHPDRDLGHVVLFVHGLGETEHAWRLADEDSAGEGYAERIASSVGAVPLLLRYNSGMRIAHNGAALSVLLAELTERWPVPIRRLDLVGHSMGGLVLRHACHAAVVAGEPWVRAVRRMVYLGSPHRGAPLAHQVDRLAGRLAKYAQSRTWGEFLDRRSAGIRDLVAGVADTDVPLLAHSTHHGVAAAITASEHHPLATILGDLLVPVDSARGAITDVETLPSSHHFHLLNDPRVHEHLLRWLAADPEQDDGADLAIAPTVQPAVSPDGEDAPDDGAVR